MREVEVKARIASDRITDICEWLAGRGFKRINKTQQIDDYYDHPSRSFRETDEALRVRCILEENGEPEAVLTYKGKNLSEFGQTREELEVVIGDPDVMTGILERLGFRCRASVDKIRTTYVMEDITFSMDSVKELGDFIEIEIMCAEGQETGSGDRIARLLEELSFASPVTEKATYLDMILEK